MRALFCQGLEFLTSLFSFFFFLARIVLSDVGFCWGLDFLTSLFCAKDDPLRLTSVSGANDSPWPRSVKDWTMDSLTDLLTLLLPGAAWTIRHDSRSLGFHHGIVLTVKAVRRDSFNLV